MADDNTLKDVQNLLGFLLAGFAGILGFLGLRSAEVTTVLRNHSGEAGIIALLLLFAALFAAGSIAVRGDRKLRWSSAAAAFTFLIAVTVLTIYVIPIEPARIDHREQVAMDLAIGLAVLACIFLALLRWPYAGEEHYGKWRGGQIVPVQFAGIAAAVIMLVSGVYGAMRLETASQLTSSVQLTASLARDKGGLSLTIHVAGNRIQTVGYIGVTIFGLPAGVPLASECQGRPAPEGAATCADDPCDYLVRQCLVIAGGTVPPDGSGDIRGVITDGLITGKFQDISIRARVCQTVSGCTAKGTTGTGQVSRLDIHLSDLQPRFEPASGGTG